MPIYEYICNACQQSFEVLVRRYDEPVNCSHCQSSDITKLISQFSFAGNGGNTAKPHTHTAGKSCGACSSSNCGSCS